jgi:hypothetical protein
MKITSLSLRKSRSKLRRHSFKSLRTKSKSRSRSLDYSPLKSISITKSDQGEEGTCLAHACAHLVVKNVFDSLYPLKLSKKEENIYKKHSCNEYLKTHNLMDIAMIPDCSIRGYDKILLFLYVYFTAYENFILKGKKNYLTPIIKYILQLEYIPRIFDQTFHLPRLHYLLKTIKHKMVGIKYDTVTITTKDPLIIRKILDRFYVAMNLTHGSEGHTSTIVDHTPTQFIIKNSWRENLDYVPYEELDSAVFVYSNTKWKIQDYVTVLPIYKNMDLYDGFREDFVTDLEIEEREIELYKPWIFNYISNFKNKSRI